MLEERGTLITGATGFLGGEVLARLLERDERPVYALVRAGDEQAARARLRGVVEGLTGRAGRWSPRLVAVRGDVTASGLGLGFARREWLAERVDRIIHCAASVSFALGDEESRAINLDGTRRVLDLARLCARRGDGLEHLVHVSTAYVAGDHDGTFGEADLDVGQRWRNGYERSKYEAELLVRERGGELPAQIVRPSIVVGDSRSGWTPAFNVVYGPLRAFCAGALAAIPGRRTAPVDVVPVDYVADSILALAGRPGATHHLVAGERASSVGELIELASAYTGRRPPLVLPPSAYRGLIHPLLVRSGSQKRRRVLRRSEALFPYFSMRVRYDDLRARAALGVQGIEAPPLASYFNRLLDFAEGANWGRELPARHAAERVAEPRRRERLRGRNRGRVSHAITES
jgi:long-chain acyl-CoA synthetase